MIESITDGEPYVLTAEDVAEVEKIEQGYYDPAFMRISANKTSETAKGKRHVSNNSIIKGLGEFCVEFDIDPAGSHISNVSISGDFFMHGDVDEAICRRLEGAEMHSRRPHAYPSRDKSVRNNTRPHPRSPIPHVHPKQLKKMAEEPPGSSSTWRV